MKNLSSFINYKNILGILFLIFSSIIWGQTTTTITTVGNGTWQVPCDVTSITVEVWGAGGGGQRVSGNSSAGGGGSGGGYVRATRTVTPGSTINFYVGQGGSGNSGQNGEASWFISNSTVRAVGGNGAGSEVTSNNSYGSGANAPSSGNIGGTITSSYGGNGGNAGNLYSGGGGSSAGTSASNNATGMTGGAAPTNGYAGANGRDSSGVGANGGIGAGGAGGRTHNNTDRNGGAGGNGQIRITHSGTTYCSKSFSTVEPITNVTFAGINKTTSPDINGSPALEEFCDEANVMTGNAYSISLKGNTNGNYTNYFRVYIDWNQNGTFETTEGYDIGTINSSTGTDSKVVTGTINVPLTAQLGSTKMRVVKNYNSYATACNNNTYGQAEDYRVIVAPMPECTGTPTGGVANLTPNNGAPSSVFNATVSGGSIASGLSYQWQISSNGTSGWTDIAGATSENANITAVPTPSTTRYYRRKVTCSISGQIAFSSIANFTTTAPSYCTPTTQTAGALFIQNLSIYGMSDTPITNHSTFSNNGYSDFTTNPLLIAQQAQGEGVNIEASVGEATMSRGRWKAWVDWNGDGDFSDAGEEVYNAGGIVSPFLGFGFEVPENQPPGDYRIRIRVNNSLSFLNSEGYGFDYSSCDSFVNGFPYSNYGETEDYLIRVIENCSAKITSVVIGNECNTEDGVEITLSATASQNVTEFRWYNSAVGGVLIGTSAPDATGMSTDWTTPVISGTTTYYVTAFNGTCESTFRTEVIAVVQPTPEISFTPTVFDICGNDAIIAVSASGADQVVTILEEDFEGTGLGGFQNVIVTDHGTNNTKVNWTRRTSVYTPAPPTYLSWFPAISSGFGENKFAMMNTDVNMGSPIERVLRSPVNLNSMGMTTLSLELRMFYSRHYSDGVSPDMEFVTIDVSTNNGTTWTEIDRFIEDVGRATKFEKLTYNLDSYVNNGALRVRVRTYSWAGEGWLASGVAVDDIKLYGTKPLEPSFDWVSTNPIGVYTDPEGTEEYTGGAINTIYIKPTEAQLELYGTWDITATAELENGCEAEGTVSIDNNTKIWNPDFAASDWNSSSWKPLGALPTADQCVVIRKPVNVQSGINGLAKSIKVEADGFLTIKSGGSLKVTNEIVNLNTEDYFILENDANLIQLDPEAENVGKIKVFRNSTPMVRQDATNWSSPVEGQLVRNFSPATLINRYYIYNGKTNPGVTSDYKSLFSADSYYPMTSPIPSNWYETGELLNTHFNPATYKFKKGWGYTIRVANNWPSSSPMTFIGVFVGAPNNGDITVPAYGEFTLVGNPYPSNIETAGPKGFFAQNPEVETLQFWTHKYPIGHQYYDYGYMTLTRLGTAGMINPETEEEETYSFDGKIKIGQGFLVQNIEEEGSQTEWSVYFNNGMRIDQGGEFFRMDEGQREQKHRFWVSVSDSQGVKMAQILLGYMTGATNGIDRQIDGSKMGSSPLYSLIDGKEFTVQGRAWPFVRQDVIPLGFSAPYSGNFTIALDFMDGLFAEGQDIYIKDKMLYTVHKLSSSDYTFQSEEGDFLNRFEIVFLPQGLTADTADYWTKNRVDVSKQDFNIKITSSIDKISKVEIFNLAGWSVYKNTEVNSTEIIIPAVYFGKQIIVVTGVTEKGEIFTEKLIIK